MSLVESHIGMKLVTPLPVTVGFTGAMELPDFVVVDDAAAVELLLLAAVLAEFASAKAEAGRPPTVSASPAFKA
jgi:hypothetical protein